MPTLSTTAPVRSGTATEARVAVGDETWQLRWSLPHEAAEGADHVLAATLPVALATADALEVGGTVSPRLLAAADEIAEILRLWGPTLGTAFRAVPVRAAERPGSEPASSATACFFSGGVDSFHTLLRHRAEVDAVIFVHGFDIPLGHTALRARASATARQVAEALSLELIEVETDLRTLSDRFVTWEAHHGAALASVALLLQHRFGRVLVPATRTYDNLLPWGSHPLLDPLWSTERLRFVHAGAGTSRVGKVAAIAHSDLALRHLRVCWQNQDGTYNCGRCEKCVRTMLSLAVAGALDRCKTLPDDLDPAHIASLTFTSAGQLAVARENREALAARGGFDDVVAALAIAEQRSLSGGAQEGLAQALARAEAAERALADFQGTRRYRLAQRIAGPLDAVRLRAGRRRGGAG